MISLKSKWISGAALAVGVMLPGVGHGQEAAAPITSPVTVASYPPEQAGLTLEETIRRVVAHNESLQIKMLEAEISRRQFKAEKGIFEPVVVGGYERFDSQRENTQEQQSSLFSFLSATNRTAFNERNDLFNGGLEFLAPVGSKFRLGYNLRRLRNNLNATTRGAEYVTTVGLSVTQPLLKNFGPGATLVRIRLAAVNSDIAYQDYRRQLMLTLTRAESAYWDLYLTQEQHRITGESLATAEKIARDNKERLSVGKSSELEVLEANAGVSLRLARRNEAEQKLNEAATQLSTLFSGHTGDKPSAVRAVEAPEVTNFELTFYDCYKRAFELNPDYLSRKSQALAENIRLAYAKNQLLPQLDLKGSYGLNGLGSDVGDSFEDVQGADYPAWSVGVELRIPVTGGMKERNEYKAAQLNRQKALISIKEAEVQLGNALSSSLLKVRNLRANIASQREVIGFHEQLLETQLARLDVGVVDSRAVFETEEKLFQARIDLLETMVDFQKALLENELYQGGVLQARNMDLSKAQLQEQTSRLLAANRFGGPEMDTIRSEVEQDYRARVKRVNGNERPATLKETLFE